MQKKFLLLFLLVTVGINAQEWIVITPLPYCTKFTIEYNFDNGYNVRYKPNPDSSYIIHNESLENINNLASMTDILVDSAANYCSFSIGSTQTDQLELEGVACHEDRKSSSPFSDSYSGLLKEIITVINKAGDNCNDVIPLIALQQEISQLEGNELITFDKSGSILKLFSGDENDVLIDHFYECGGEDGSQQFVENLIILETKNACIFPAPPGLLSFEKAKELAHEIAKEYPDHGLLKISGKSDDITKDVVLRFTDEILRSQITDIFGDEVDTNAFIKDLDVVNALKKTKPSKTLDFASYILKVDAPLEIIEKGIPLLVSQNFSSMLSKDLTPKQKEDFLKKEITPVVTDNYRRCIEDFKSVVKYPNNYSNKKTQKKLVKHRKKLEKRFCNENSDICENKTCGGDSINLGSTDSNKTDMAQMQACLFRGLTLSIKPMLRKVIADQKDTFKDYFDLDKIMSNKMADKAFDKLHSCTDERIKKISGATYKEKYTENITALYDIDSTQFSESLKSCAQKTELDLTGDFVTLLLANMDSVKETYGTPETTSLYGRTLSHGANNFARDVIAKTLPQCTAHQLEVQRKDPSQVASAINCRSLFEMEAASRLIAKTIEKTYKENNVDQIVAKNKLSTFNVCTNQAKLDATSSLLNPRHKTPVLTSTDAENFLSKNNTFYQCVTKLVSTTADLVANTSIEELLTENKDKLSDFDAVMSLKPKVVAVTKACFDKKMSELGSWPNFIEFNSQDGLEELKDQCTARATEFILPKIIISETTAKLGSLVKTNIINETQLSLILSKIASKLETEFVIPVPLSLQISREEYVMKEAFKKFTKNNPNKENNIDQFVEKIYEVTLGTAIPQIKVNIVDQLAIDSKPGFDFDNLKTTLSPNCLNAYYEQNKDKIENLIGLIAKHSTNTESIDLRELFINYLKKGLIRSTANGRYQDLSRELQLICEDPKNYKDLNKIVETGIADDILISVVQTKLKKSFAHVAQEQCFKDINSAEIVLIPELLNKLCARNNLSQREMSRLKTDLLLAVTNPRQKSLLDFIANKKFTADKQVENELDMNLMEELFYNDREMLNYIYENFDSVAASVPENSNKLIKIVSKKIFEKTGTGSFAENFVENQIIAGIGANYDTANKKVSASLKELPFWYKALDSMGNGIITEHARVSFNERWTYKGVKGYLNIQKTSKKEKKSLIDAVYKFAIAPRLDESISDEVKVIERDKLTVFVESFIENTKQHKNPSHRPASTRVLMGGTVHLPGNAEKISFEDKLAIDIESSVEGKVKADLGM
jgi:hypothetical protein